MTSGPLGILPTESGRTHTVEHRCWPYLVVGASSPTYVVRTHTYDVSSDAHNQRGVE